MHAELALDAGAVDAVAQAEPTVAPDHEFRHEEERDPAGPRFGVWQAGQHEMDDVVRHVVVAIGDVDLGTGDGIAAVGPRLRPGPQRAEVGARLRLREVHRAGPFARDQLAEVEPLQVVGAVRRDGLDGTGREQRAEAERQIGGAPDLGAGRCHESGEALSAVGLGGRHTVPSALDPAPVGVGPAGCRRDGPVGEPDPGPVADPVEGLKEIGREPPGLVDHRRGGAVRQRIVRRRRGCRSRHLHGIEDIGGGRAIGHGVLWLKRALIIDGNAIPHEPFRRSHPDRMVPAG